jgi:SlyX protein
VSDDSTDRIERLEEQVAHQARVIEELSDQVQSLWTLVEALKRKQKMSGERLADLEDLLREKPAITKPPHY